MDEQLEVLRSIWGETSTLDANVTTTNARLEELRSEMAVLRGEIKTGMIGIRHEIRSEVGELSHNVRDLTLLLHDWREEHRLDRDDLRVRVERLERRAGLEPR